MPGWNFELALGTRRLTRLLGAQFASDMLIETRALDALCAVDIGFATRMAEPAEFEHIIDRELQRTSLLSSYAVQAMLDITRTDTREADIAALVKTAGRPGLRDRIAAYRERVMGQKRPASEGQ